MSESQTFIIHGPAGTYKFIIISKFAIVWRERTEEVNDVELSLKRRHQWPRKCFSKQQETQTMQHIPGTKWLQPQLNRHVCALYAVCCTPGSHSDRVDGCLAAIIIEFHTFPLTDQHFNRGNVVSKNVYFNPSLCKWKRPPVLLMKCPRAGVAQPRPGHTG